MSDHICCKEEIDDLIQKINNCALKSNNLKQEYKQLLIQNLEKDVKIKNLKKQLASQKFSIFKDKLSDSCLCHLEAIGNDISAGSTFVSCVLNNLYDLSTLQKLTLSGASKATDTIQISREKRDILEEIFQVRLTYIPFEEVD